jgi:hypothetical protein
VHATYPTHFLLDLIILIIFGEEYKLCSSLYPLVDSSCWAGDELVRIW